MKKVKTNVEWASDGTVSVYMEEESFSGMGDNVDAAIEDMKKGVTFFIQTAKEEGFPYKDYLDGEYELDLNYDIQSLLEYAENFMTDKGIAKLSGVSPVLIGRYSNGQAKPRKEQAMKILKSLQEFGQKFAAIAL